MAGASIVKPSLLSLVAGLALPLAFAPFDHWWLAFLSPLVPLYFWLRLPPGQAARVGFAFGAAAFLAGTYWLYISVHVFGQTPLAIAVALMLGLVLIMGVYYLLAGALVARYARGGAPPWLLIAGIAAIWTLLEWLRGWVLSGFPWLSLGYSQLSSPLAGFAPVAGVYAVSFFAALVTAAAAVAWSRGLHARIVAGVAVAVVFGGGAMLKRVDWTEPSGQPFAAALIQGGIPQNRKWLPEEFEPTLRLYRDLTMENLDAKIIVWPEVAVPAVRQRVGPYLAKLDAVVEAAGVALVLGIPEVDPERGRSYNSMITLGEVEASYQKRHLVPFGEYFPVPQFVREWMRLRSLPYSDMARGARVQPVLDLGGHAAAVSICYEDAFAAEQLGFFPAAELIVNISNDAWFGDSIAPHHHLDIARMRSLEAGRWQLRATNTGITAFIDPQGRLAATSPQFEPAVLKMPIEPRSGMTPYLVTGNWPLLLLSFALVALLEVRLRWRVSGA